VRGDNDNEMRYHDRKRRQHFTWKGPVYEHLAKSFQMTGSILQDGIEPLAIYGTDSYLGSNTIPDSSIQPHPLIHELGDGAGAIKDDASRMPLDFTSNCGFKETKRVTW